MGPFFGLGSFQSTSVEDFGIVRIKCLMNNVLSGNDSMHFKTKEKITCGEYFY